MEKLKRFPQIDGIKGIAIIDVLLIHTIPIAYRFESHTNVFLRQAIPVFMIAMGLTWFYSFSKLGSPSLKELYSRKYFNKRVTRFIIPFLPIAIIGAILAALTFHEYPLTIGPSTIAFLMIGILPFPLAGGYFISLLIQFIFIAPLLYIFFKKAPLIALIATFGINFVFELCGPFLANNYIGFVIYGNSILRYLGALGIGFYIAPELLSKGKLNLLDRRFCFIVPIGVLSAVLFILYDASSFSFFRPDWGPLNVLTCYLPALLLILTFNVYSYISRIDRRHVLELLGRASYHIYLVQMIYFYILLFLSDYGQMYYGWPTSATWQIVTIALVVSIGINVLIGILYYKIEGKLREIFNKRCAEKKDTVPNS